jgi:hypothetical protein
MGLRHWVPIRLFAPFVGKPINVARLRHGMKKRRLCGKAATEKGIGARFATEWISQVTERKRITGAGPVLPGLLQLRSPGSRDMEE